MLPIIWVGAAALVITAAIRSWRDPRARRSGEVAVAVLYVGAGALINALMLLRGDDYAKFADGAYVSFVRDTWRSLVVPHHHLFITALIVFEAAVGVLAAAGGKLTRIAYVAAIAFHIALLSFGWGFYVWSIPLIAALAVLLRSEQPIAVGRTS